MSTRRIALALLLGLTLMIALGGVAFAAERGPIQMCPLNPGQSEKCYISLTGSPISNNSIVPETWNDNPNCQAMGYGYGFKLNGAPTGTFTLIATNGNLTGGAPGDSVNTVTVVSSDDDKYLTWSSTLAMDAVFVKGGPTGGNLYVYDPESMGLDSGLAVPNAGGAISHVEFCYDYELDPTKTADAKYTRTYTWDITKSVDPASHSGFAGDTFSSDYEVIVDQTIIDSGWKVTGVIDVINPSPFSVDFTVTDSVGGTPATVICPTNSVGPGLTVQCTYSANLAGAVNGTNTATVSVASGPLAGDYLATADYTFGDPTTTFGSPTINVTDYFDGDLVGEALFQASDDLTFEYDRDFACPTNEGLYTNGVYTDSFPNLAKIDETGQQDGANVDLTCYLWDVSKTAAGSYNDRYGWNISKTVDPEFQSGFAGDTLEWTWSITWGSFLVGEINHAVSGVITVVNPADIELTVAVADQLSGGFAATVTCNDADGGTALTIAANSVGTCDYSAAPGSQLAQNTATASRNGVSVSDTVNVNWVKGADVGLDAEISDRSGVEIPVGSDQPFEYDNSHVCSTDAADYGEDGTTGGSARNIATITWTGGSNSSDAYTFYDCYLWDVSKTADGSYNGQYEWDITKTVDPESQSGFAGDTLSWTWSITWGSSFVEEINHAVSGIITVDNPADIELTVDVTDYLTGPFAATVTCNDGDGGTDLTIAANSSGTCNYSAAPSSQLAQNTATATRNGVSVSDTVNVNWVKGADVGLDAEISDSNNGEIPVGSVQPFEYDDSHVCSTDAADYGEDGTYSGDASNTATITWTGGSDSSTAETSYLCAAGFMDLLKTTNGAVNPAMSWSFELYEGPDGFGTTPIGSSSTSGDLDGVLEFGNPALSPDKTYTICELGVPAGYSSNWMVNGVIVNPDNPDANNATPEDLGNRCVDFGAGTTIPVTVGTTIHFEVDNTAPGGDPRTPGYWKNWNACTRGGQAANAERNGGYANGFWLLEDVLDPSIGGGIVWDDILPDGFEVTIDSCEQAVEILNQRVVTDNGIVGDGRKLASDGARTLAMHLLAAQLNFGAGACTTQYVNDTALAAERLLDSINFDGTNPKAYLTSKSPLYAEALRLAGILDNYNNGEYCGSTYTP